MLIKWATGFIDFVTIRHPSPWSISVQVSACWLLQTKRKLQLFQIIEMHFIMSWKWPGTPRSPTAVLSNVHCYQGLIHVRGYNEQPHRTAAAMSSKPLPGTASQPFVRGIHRRTVEFPSHMANYTERISNQWCHRALLACEYGEEHQQAAPREPHGRYHTCSLKQ